MQSGNTTPVSEALDRETKKLKSVLAKATALTTILPGVAGRHLAASDVIGPTKPSMLDQHIQKKLEVLQEVANRGTARTRLK